MEIVCCGYKLIHQLLIPAEYRIHIAKPCGEYGASLGKPPGLIKAADISRTTARITDNNDATQIIQHSARSGLIRSKRRHIFPQAFHDTASFICTKSFVIPANPKGCTSSDHRTWEAPG